MTLDEQLNVLTQTAESFQRKLTDLQQDIRIMGQVCDIATKAFQDAHAWISELSAGELSDERMQQYVAWETSLHRLLFAFPEKGWPQTAIEQDRATMQSRMERLSQALAGLYRLIVNEVDMSSFRNGVTDSTGTIDEGEVKAGALLSEAKAILVELGDDSTP